MHQHVFLHTTSNEFGFQVNPIAHGGMIYRVGNRCLLCVGRVFYQSIYALAIRENTVMVAQETYFASINDVCIAQNDVSIFQNPPLPTSLSFFQMPICSENNKVHASENIAQPSDVKRGHINRLLANL